MPPGRCLGCLSVGGRVGMKPVFISYATSDRKEALSVCEAIERRGVPCWIACRDVQPGENYQEAIVKAIRGARAMVLVFSDRANNSDEIKKEMSLVSRFHIPMLALRIEDVEPGDAFAYELATRQWIDLFEDWDKSIDALVNRVGALKAAEDAAAGDGPAAAPASRPVAQRAAPPPAAPSKRGFKAGSLIAVAAAVLALVAIGAASWFFLRGSQAKAEHPMEVRWTGFQTLSPDLPQSMPTAMRDETISAFSDDGVVGVSIAPAPKPGDGPAYALSGTIRRDGDRIRVIAHLVNERSGTTLWSNDFSYDAVDEAKIPRRFAIKIGDIVRCGLFAASTYPRTMPDTVMSNYIQGCAHGGIIDDDVDKQLDALRKVVAAAPDFSWGWSGLAGAIAYSANGKSAAEQKPILDEGIAAADKAVALDPTNSEALSIKAEMIDLGALQDREVLFKQALKARPLACGCEHHLYGLFLDEVGRREEAIAEYRRSIAVLALEPGSQIALGYALTDAGRADEARPHLEAAVELSGRPYAQDRITVDLAPTTHQYAAAARIVRSHSLPMSPAVADAFAAAFDALASGNPAAKAAAVPALVKVRLDAFYAPNVVELLGALGANQEALQAAEAAADQQVWDVRAAIFKPAMAGVRADPAFPAAADRLGFTRYWKASHITPDFCKAADAPAYCKTLG